MNIDLNKILAAAGAKKSHLDPKKEQTEKKIEYVISYVQEWIRVGCMSHKIRVLNFIDAMSNAGIYEDGELGTAVRVYELFLEAAKKFPDMKFNLVFNDLDDKRVEVFKAVVSEITDRASVEKPNNIDLYCSVNDINVFIEDLPKHDGLLNSYDTLTLLFIDPYDARTVNVALLRQYLQTHYCELFYNWFSSDHVRNPGDSAIQHCFSGLDIPEGRDAASFVAQYLAGDKKHFSYSFRNQKNAEIYQIIFITPSPTGLKKIKAALWQTFKGEEYHRNHQVNYEQGSLFDSGDGKKISKEMRESFYGKEVQKVLIEELEPGEYTYAQIELFVLQRSMLGENAVIRYVINPLIAENKMKKLGIVGPRNYKQDRYKI